jgi:hypothetical protein
MTTPESSCWTADRAAAAGNPADREELACRYLGVVRAYLAAPWRGADLQSDLEDAVQEVFVECFREGGALEAAANGRVPSFRPFTLWDCTQRSPPVRKSALSLLGVAARPRGERGKPF